MAHGIRPGAEGALAAVAMGVFEDRSESHQSLTAPPIDSSDKVGVFTRDLYLADEHRKRALLKVFRQYDRGLRRALCEEDGSPIARCAEICCPRNGMLATI
jgi:hypothetical protein